VYSNAKRNSILWMRIWRRAAPARFAALVSNSTALLAADGSTVSGAPSYTLFGAFFPAWMICAVIGIFGAIGARAAMVSSGLAKVLPYQLFVCASIGLIVALLVWLIWFGR
jgi:YtcA family